MLYYILRWLYGELWDKFHYSPNSQDGVLQWAYGLHHDMHAVNLIVALVLHPHRTQMLVEDIITKTNARGVASMEAHRLAEILYRKDLEW